MPIDQPAVSSSGSLFGDLGIIILVLAGVLIAVSVCSSYARNTATRSVQRVISPLYGPPELHEEIARAQEAAAAPAEVEEDSESARAQSSKYYEDRELSMLHDEMFRDQ